jgi:hypothetical protein
MMKLLLSLAAMAIGGMVVAGCNPKTDDADPMTQEDQTTTPAPPADVPPPAPDPMAPPTDPATDPMTQPQPPAPGTTSPTEPEPPPPPNG